MLSPLVGFLINGLRWRRHSANLAGTIATLAAVVSFGCSIALFAQILELPAEGARAIRADFFDWIVLSDLRVPAAFVVDQISGIMILVVTGVGSLIHLFSVGYMHHDKGAAKYFAYLNLFLFNMLILVLGASLPIMFVGWEGVGLCSYLLIGFWFTDKDKAAAGMKAFVTNRVGDAAFILGMFFLIVTFGTLDFQEINGLVPATPIWAWGAPTTLAALFLFIGATGKSAQIPLYVWLPDAMAGPTPVSALIHAATMVTAGVYMIVRLNPLFISAPYVMNVIAVIGAATALFAATIGITQWDIKKVLAYSTVSQLGYMFLACGVGAFGAAMFHLVTHAFFKALMFLGSGSVIHAMHEEQDIRKMGALRKWLPITHVTFLLGWLAIIGMPPFAGFFSKDEILWKAFIFPEIGQALWVVGFITAVLTAFYMTRLMTLTFWGTDRVDPKTHPHEAPWQMALPLVVLGVLSVVGGWMGIPHVLAEYIPGNPHNWLEHWLEPMLRTLPGTENAHHEASLEMGLMAVSVIAAALSAAFAFSLYRKGPEGASKIAGAFGKFHQLVADKYRIDELYEMTVIKPVISLGRNLWASIDVNVIDKTTYVLADLMKGGGSFVRSVQTGNIQHYALYVAMGVVAAMTFVLVR